MRNKETIETVFGTDTRFELNPLPAAPFRGMIETDLERLKARLLKDRLAHTAQVDAVVPLRRAANEAAALAWLTAYPILVFPALFEEKARQARRQLNKQARVLARSEGISVLAA